MAHAQTVLLAKQRQELATWAGSTVARAAAHPVLQGVQTASISADLGVAVSILSSLRQAGLRYGAPAVTTIIGVDMTTARSVPTSPASLQSSTVVVDDFPGTTFSCRSAARKRS